MYHLGNKQVGKYSVYTALSITFKEKISTSYLTTLDKMVGEPTSPDSVIFVIGALH